MSTMATEALIKEIHVDASPETAFRVFTEQIGRWWPVERYSLFEDEIESVTFGRDRIVERAKNGREAVWGEVLEFDVAGRLRFTWHPGHDEPTEVEVTFVADGDGTLVTLVHSGWERLSEERRAGRAGYDSGWNLVLERFRAAI